MDKPVADLCRQLLGAVVQVNLSLRRQFFEKAFHADALQGIGAYNGKLRFHSVHGRLQNYEENAENEV